MSEALIVVSHTCISDVSLKIWHVTAFYIIKLRGTILGATGKLDFLRNSASVLLQHPELACVAFVQCKSGVNLIFLVTN